MTTDRERTKCLLIAGKALVHLRRYPEARQHYLMPAAALDAADVASRVHLFWNYLGFCAFVEHDFTEALETFRKSNGADS